MSVYGVSCGKRLNVCAQNQQVVRIDDCISPFTFILLNKPYRVINYHASLHMYTRLQTRFDDTRQGSGCNSKIIYLRSYN